MTARRIVDVVFTGVLLVPWAACAAGFYTVAAIHTALTPLYRTRRNP